jgi:hypothetical protein
MWSLFPIYFFDSLVLNTSSTPIPANSGSFLEVVANSGTRAAYAIQYMDTSGDYIGVYLGSPGNETLLCVIGGGQTSIVPAVVAARTRVSVRSITSTAVTNGKVFCTFLGNGLK